MQLPPAVAGVTLLSFAGGAPDLFTQLAAVSTGTARACDAFASCEFAEHSFAHA